jgi:hypothetical protein
MERNGFLLRNFCNRMNPWAFVREDGVIEGLTVLPFYSLKGQRTKLTDGTQVGSFRIRKTNIYMILKLTRDMACRISAADRFSEFLFRARKESLDGRAGEEKRKHEGLGLPPCSQNA